jgi:putative two-component system response regulator
MAAADSAGAPRGSHGARVASYVALIAEELGFAPERCRLLSLASTMHDIGKAGVPEAIRTKPGPLTPDERDEMQRHAEHGRALLDGSNSAVVKLAAEIAASHHERWDGAGYPNRLRGEDIPLSGRIVAVADVFDALTSRRPYKEPWSLDEAKAHLLANAGSHFDPACVEAFLARWPEIIRLAAAGPPASEP